MQNLTFLICLIALGSSLTSTTAEAQQQRTFGRPLQRQAGPQRLPNVAEAAETAGGITGSERFLRDRRQPGAFVGSDQANTRFVGSGAVIESGRVRSAVESLPPAADPSAQVNLRYAPAGAAQPYAPRLILDFETTNAPNQPNDAQVRQRETKTQLELRELLDRIDSPSVAVEIEQRVAYVTGPVATARQRDLALLLVSMQPGISRVVDQTTLPQLHE
jgi:hypothetical protein